MGRPKGAVSKQGKRKRAKDPNKPKRPTSAYFYFVADQREKMNKQGKKVTRVAEWTKEVSAIWRELGPKEREPFEKKAVIDKQRYTTAMNAYKGKDEDKPKRPQSAYFLWLADYRIRMKGKFTENKELLKGAGEAWKRLTEGEKKPYEIKAEQGRKDYEVAMREYHQMKGRGGATAAKKQKVEEVKNGNEDDDEEEEDEEEEEEDDDDEEEEEDDDE